VKIEDVVDLRRFKYVQNEANVIIPTRYGDLRLIYALISDGASNVVDLCFKAFMGHDQLNLIPIVYRKEIDNEGHVRYQAIRLNHLQVDTVYGDLLADKKLPLFRIAGFIRSRFLMAYNFLPFSAWARYRRQEKRMGWCNWEAHVMRTRVVPHATCWWFPDIKLKNAKWKEALAYA
jgi:hypothetical protein